MMSVDGTDCPIEKKGKRWYSHKFKKPGVRYEVGVAIKSGDIVWINRPYPCGEYPDLKIFQLALKFELDEDERVEADAGYRGEPKVKAAGPHYTNKCYKKMKKKVASRHKTVNKTFEAI